MGNFALVFPESAIDGWDVTVTFDRDIDKLEVWNFQVSTETRPIQAPSYNFAVSRWKSSATGSTGSGTRAGTRFRPTGSRSSRAGSRSPTASRPDNLLRRWKRKSSRGNRCAAAEGRQGQQQQQQQQQQKQRPRQQQQPPQRQQQQPRPQQHNLQQRRAAPEDPTAPLWQNTLSLANGESSLPLKISHHLVDAFDFRKTGIHGEISVPFDTGATNGWSLTFHFDKDVETFSFWQGDNQVTKVNSRTFVVKNASWNSFVAANTEIDSGFMITFREENYYPKITSITLDGRYGCSGGGGGATTTATATTTTEAATTTAAAATSSTTTSSGNGGGGGSCLLNDFDYGQALELSLLFYEAQRSGKLPANQVSQKLMTKFTILINKE